MTPHSPGNRPQFAILKIQRIWDTFALGGWNDQGGSAVKLFFSVGEPSGDLHGANLIRALRARCPDAELVGYGGPRMAAAGLQLHDDLTRLAVMGILPAVRNLHRFWVLWRKADRWLQLHRPDGVVLIDYPGFNWWIARSAKRYGIPVFYYGVPQMWAWAGWRVNKLRRLVDHVLCKLPFEPGWFRCRGVDATYVGHPYYDEVSQRLLDAEFVRIQRAPGPLVTILPGSRRQEVTNNLPAFLRTAAIVEKQVPGVRFAIASFSDSQAEIAREMVAQSGLSAEVFVGRTPELIDAAHCCLACSGSVSLELLWHQKPTVIHYRLSSIGALAKRLVVKVRFITLVNLLATDEVFLNRGNGRPDYNPESPDAEPVPFPEFATCHDKSQAMASWLVKWLTCPDEYQQRIRQLQELKSTFAHPGASATAAEYLLRSLFSSDGPTLRDAA
jgi:lipid-A-disaccharide synthase